MAKGVKLVFMDGAAEGLLAGKDYISIVSGDNMGNRATAAEIMAEKLGGKGKIGIVYHDVDFFVTKHRLMHSKQGSKKNIQILRL